MSGWWGTGWGCVQQATGPHLEGLASVGPTGRGSDQGPLEQHEPPPTGATRWGRKLPARHTVWGDCFCTPNTPTGLSQLLRTPTPSAANRRYVHSAATAAETAV